MKSTINTVAFFAVTGIYAYEANSGRLFISVSFGSLFAIICVQILMAMTDMAIRSSKKRMKLAVLVVAVISAAITTCTVKTLADTAMLQAKVRANDVHELWHDQDFKNYDQLQIVKLDGLEFGAAVFDYRVEGDEIRTRDWCEDNGAKYCTGATRDAKFMWYIMNWAIAWGFMGFLVVACAVVTISLIVLVLMREGESPEAHPA